MGRNSFLSPLLYWDDPWYRLNLTQDYIASNGSAIFHPLNRCLATPLSQHIRALMFNLTIIGFISEIGSLFSKLLQYKISSNDPFFEKLLLSFAIPSLILFAPYIQGLFFLLPIFCILSACQNKGWLAGLLSERTTLTLQQEILFHFPMGIGLSENSEHKSLIFKKLWKDWLSVSLIQIGMLAWLLSRAIQKNDFQIKINSIQGFIHSTLLYSKASNLVPIHKYIWLRQTFINSLTKPTGIPKQDFDINSVSVIVSLINHIVSRKNLPIASRIYSLVIYIISIKFHTDQIHALINIPRHSLIIFPTFYSFDASFRKIWIR